MNKLILKLKIHKQLACLTIFKMINIFGFQNLKIVKIK